jgi:hypothetical protein
MGYDSSPILTPLEDMSETEATIIAGILKDECKKFLVTDAKWLTLTLEDNILSIIDPGPLRTYCSYNKRTFGVKEGDVVRIVGSGPHRETYAIIKQLEEEEVILELISLEE